MNPSLHPRKRGTALIIALFFVVLISVVTLGYLGSARIERSTAGSHFERMRATALARDGVESVVAILQRETTDPNRNWVSQPGALIVPDADPKRLQKQVALSTGVPSAGFLATEDALLDFEPPDLNVQTLADQSPPTYLITDRLNATGGPTQMKLRWIYVRSDGSQLIDASGLPVEAPDRTDKANPIVGRFAYWADDESSKINYNLAWTRSSVNTNPPAHPTRVTLKALTGMTDPIANQIHQFITKPDGTSGNKLDYEKIANRFFNTPSDVRGAVPAAYDVLLANKFELTHFNHDPDTTFFNESRIVLTTLPNWAGATYNATSKTWSGGRPFLDILKNSLLQSSNPTVDPGAVANIDPVKLNYVIVGNPATGQKGLLDYLKRTDWPMVNGSSSFQQKYYGTSTSIVRLTELALNLIDYVRSAESAMTLVEPIRGIIRKDTSGKDYFVGDFSNTPPYSDSSIRGKDNTYKGLTRSLFVTEMGVWVKGTAETSGANNGRYRCKFYNEIHLPEAGGIDSIDFNSIDGKRMYLYTYETTGTSNYYSETGSGLNGKWFRVDATNIVGGNTTLSKGGYATVAITAYRASRPASVNLRTALVIGPDTGAIPSDPGTARLEVSPVADAGNGVTLKYTVDAAAVGEQDITSFEVNDPRINSVPKDWNSVAQAKNSFGVKNKRSTLGKASAAVPEQDTDLSGQITDAGMRMPHKKGHSTNPNGLVLSPGELGFIHTGVEISSTAATGGVPWRTIRLQPNQQATSVVPDWAFMDLFTVPVNVPAAGEPIFAPHKTATGGRVNMNAKPEPFALDRILPLAAVFQDAAKDSRDPAKTVSASEAKSIAHAIYARTLASKGKVYGYAGGYDSPGEIVEISGVADGGEASEELVRQVANLVTSRGNVFSIYTVGQALKQTPNGRLIVTAEQRQQAVVERYHDNRGTPDPTDDEVRFRTIYSRNLTP